MPRLSVSPAQVLNWLEEANPLFHLIDVRQKALERPKLPSTSPVTWLELKKDPLLWKNARCVLYCDTGLVSSANVLELSEIGFKEVYSLEGGLNTWQNLNLPLINPHADPLYNRYQKQILLPDVGLEGQKKWGAASVLIVGMGGLGCPVAQYLAAAGIGKLGLVDFDTVSESNLHRQILFDPKDVGQSKTDVAKLKLNALNPDCVIETYPVKLEPHNASDLMGRYDFVVCASDALSTRYVVNETCLRLKKSWVDGGVNGMKGQVVVFENTKETPCFACLFGAPTLHSTSIACGPEGVLGTLTGLVGLFMAQSTLNALLGLSSPSPFLYRMNALTLAVEKISIKKDPACRVCGQN